MRAGQIYTHGLALAMALHWHLEIALSLALPLGVENLVVLGQLGVALVALGPSGVVLDPGVAQDPSPAVQLGGLPAKAG